MADEVQRDSSSSYAEREKPAENNDINKSKLETTKKSIHAKASRVVRSTDNFSVESKESRFMRFLSKVNNFFTEILAGTERPKTEIKLTGRIHQFQEDIDRTVNNLHALHDELEREGQYQFSFLITSVINPLIKEITRLDKAENIKAESLPTAVQQVRESKDYVTWTEKAKKWIDLCAKRHTHKEVINQAFIDHTFQEFRARIDKDLQVIQDYLNSFMDRLNDNNLLKSELKDQLEEELTKHIFKLYLLKDQRPDNCLEALNDWRTQSDLERERFFSNALHAIDTHIGALMQYTVIEESIDQHIVDIHERLTSLEEKIIKFDGEVREIEVDGDEERKRMCLVNLAKMEDEAHSLNSNLQLTHEHVARVLQVIDTLSRFRDQLQRDVL